MKILIVKSVGNLIDSTSIAINGTADNVKHL